MSAVTVTQTTPKVRKTGATKKAAANTVIVGDVPTTTTGTLFKTKSAKKAGMVKITVDGGQTRVVSGTAILRAAGFKRYGNVFLASRGERFELIEQGVPATMLLSTIKDMGITQDRAFAILGFPRSTMAKKIAEGKVLDPKDSTLVIGLRRLIGQVDVMVAQSGNPKGFDAAKWVAAWLEAPTPALDGKCPAEFMHLPEGQEMLSSLLAQMQSGAYA